MVPPSCQSEFCQPRGLHATCRTAADFSAAATSAHPAGPVGQPSQDFDGCERAGARGSPRGGTRSEAERVGTRGPWQDTGRAPCRGRRTHALPERTEGPSARGTRKTGELARAPSRPFGASSSRHRAGGIPARDLRGVVPGILELQAPHDLEGLRRLGHRSNATHSWEDRSPRGHAESRGLSFSGGLPVIVPWHLRASRARVRAGIGHSRAGRREVVHERPGCPDARLSVAAGTAT